MQSQYYRTIVQNPNMVQQSRIQNFQNSPSVVHVQQSPAPIKVIHQVVVEKNLPGPCFICNHFPFIGDPAGALEQCRQQIETMRNMENLNLISQESRLDQAIQQNENLKKSRLSNQILNNNSKDIQKKESLTAFNISQKNSVVINNNNQINYEENFVSTEIEDIVKKYMNYA